MKGKYRITVENKRLRYEFEIKRNITVIRGDRDVYKTAEKFEISEEKA